MIEKIDIEAIKTIAMEAGAVIMKVYEREFSVEYKSDSSPLTEADRSSNEVICSRLQEAYPNIPLISEENRQIPYEVRKNWEYCWCVDPLDGTKEFIKRSDEFTVNIALIHQGIPVLGVVYAPAKGDMYWAKRGEGAFKNGTRLPLKNNTNPQEKLVVVASKSHLSQETQSFIDALGAKEIEHISAGSSLKFCMVAEGEADVYPRLAPTMEWDTAAADTIVREAGKMVYEVGSEIPMCYNKEELLNPWFVVR
ncbi:MAG: 3'(2'),5'-bisphosphate nucleotidase CysQ [Wolinella succinogenes]|uniref:3'(2'),5'-bisphosphate nucleotidase CysQ n=1 Tax=Wolinella succinogenes TaxID=844 RepID=UPI00169E7771|nr:3'(2'),5'-bisphosphate nucleotidase CysQ [Wolinella succinogenes]NLU35367.1 3'(2'),5'-bisphosphate nucleotidase CysQ [Wolinella succinogenes]